MSVLVEPASRAPRSVPPLELAVHFIGITAMGAAIATYIIAGSQDRLYDTALVPHEATFLPGWFFKFAFIGLIGAFALALFEATLFARAIRRRSLAFSGAPAG